MQQPDFTNFPILVTERLILRKLADTDVAEVHRLRSNPEVNKLVGRAGSATVTDTIAFINKIESLIANNESIYWAICLKEQNTLIGTVCFWNFDIENSQIETGYELLPEFQGKGLMLEAVKKVLAYGFDNLQAKIITAFPSANNAKSITLLEKINFERDLNAPAEDDETADNFLKYTLKKSN